MKATDPGGYAHVYDGMCRRAVAIWCAQGTGFEFRFVDFIQGSQQSLQYYPKELHKRPYIYGTDYLRWDRGPELTNRPERPRPDDCRGEESVRVNDPLKYSVSVLSPVRVTIFQSALSSASIAKRQASRFTVFLS
jgi:hypothetical protein